MKKMIAKEIEISILAAVLVLSTIFIFAENDRSAAATEAKFASNLKTPTSHAPIYIGGNTEFNTTNGVTGGNGTQGNPYIIENWDINASSADGIEIRSTDVYFITRNCIIHDGGDTYYGIHFFNVTNGKIENSEIYNDYEGVCLHSSSNNNISACNVYNNEHGILLDSSSNNNIITNCNVYNNSWYGICLNYSTDNTVTNCTMYNNRDGIYLYNSSNNVITDCAVYKESLRGIMLYSSSNNNQIINCNVYYNYYQGIMLSSSSNNIISNCTAHNNIWGIELGSSSNNNITNCAIYNNSWHGISLYSSSNNQIHYCNIYNNSRYGIWNYNTTAIYEVNATYNWWGNASGPYHNTTNPNGTGDNVTDNVIYEPWLTEPVGSVGQPPEGTPSEIPWLYILLSVVIIIIVIAGAERGVARKKRK